MLFVVGGGTADDADLQDAPAEADGGGPPGKRLDGNAQVVDASGDDPGLSAMT